MSHLLIVAPRGRAFCGRAILIANDGSTLAGPFRALAAASVRIAKKHDNPEASPLLPFGHPPEGSYAIVASLPPTFVHRRPRRYGHVGGLLLAPRAGQALAAIANGRKLIAIHGGPRDKKRRLRRTRGGVRLSNAHMTALLFAINAAQRNGDPTSSVELVETDMERRRRGSDRGSFVPMLLLPLALGDRIQAVRRDLLRAAAIALGTVAIQACDRASTCSPLECFSDDGGDADANDADDGGVIASGDSGNCDYDCGGGVG